MYEFKYKNIKSDRDIQRWLHVRHTTALLLKGLKAPRINGPENFCFRQYDTSHLRTESDNWTPPAPEVVGAWFDHFQKCLPHYSSDEALEALLGLPGSGGSRIRAFRQGEQRVPYEVWRRFLIMTGRVCQEIFPVIINVDDPE